ncbi:hypothetical protein UA08_03123 [Talaromyces atroroseus]|uniref:Uncharacterized protein n=1 Tax=Talaromyces atroroseus TaxID=1441469 RepID=A0A225B0X1_TALAT|nr:hypothetical protein UA08_03123 [Talaromyces atroroseus]OKL60906.1 hypothetical protein UA08_03123 [Talaromyces atroroseus]
MILSVCRDLSAKSRGQNTTIDCLSVQAFLQGVAHKAAGIMDILGFKTWVGLGILAMTSAYWGYSYYTSIANRRRRRLTVLFPKDSEKVVPTQNTPKAFKYEPAYDFDWRKTKPEQFRPFKPKYHLTMAIENLDPNHLILFDDTYETRLEIRRALLKEHNQQVVGITDENDARLTATIKELYTAIMVEYLPSRYPTIFKMTTCTMSPSSSIRNLVTGEVYPAKLAEFAPVRQALELLAKNVDEDFFILLPRSHSESSNTEEDKQTTYILHAYAACFPSGFQPAHKIGKSLSSIHGPLPGYKEKLEKSMDRFFRKLPVGKYVKRVNWSITVDEGLYSNFDKSGFAMSRKATGMTMDDLDLNRSFLRCERQTLHRLPQSKAIIFAFHTYQYPLQQIKAEGLGEQLAIAVDGLKLGNAPEIYTYKNAPKWAEAVKQYMRS